MENGNLKQRKERKGKLPRRIKEAGMVFLLAAAGLGAFSLTGCQALVIEGGYSQNVSYLQDLKNSVRSDVYADQVRAALSLLDMTPTGHRQMGDDSLRDVWIDVEKTRREGLVSVSYDSYWGESVITLDERILKKEPDLVPFLLSRAFEEIRLEKVKGDMSLRPSDLSRTEWKDLKTVENAVLHTAGLKVITELNEIRPVEDDVYGYYYDASVLKSYERTAASSGERADRLFFQKYLDDPYGQNKQLDNRYAFDAVDAWYSYSDDYSHPYQTAVEKMNRKPGNDSPYVDNEDLFGFSYVYGYEWDKDLEFFEAPRRVVSYSSAGTAQRIRQAGFVKTR